MLAKRKSFSVDRFRTDTRHVTCEYEYLHTHSQIEFCSHSKETFQTSVPSISLVMNYNSIFVNDAQSHRLINMYEPFMNIYNDFMSV